MIVKQSSPDDYTSDIFQSDETTFSRFVGS